MKILDVTGLTRRFQTTVPKLVREILEITAEDRIVWISDGGEIKVAFLGILLIITFLVYLLIYSETENAKDYHSKTWEKELEEGHAHE